MFIPEKETFDFVISCTDYVQSVLMPPVLRKVGELAPNARIAIKNLERNKIHSQLENDESHLAIMPSGNAPTSMRATHLLNESFVVVGKKGSLPKNLNVDWYCAQKHLIVEPSNTNFYGQVDRKLKAIDRTRNVTCSTQSFISAVQLLQNSSLIATIPKLLALKHSNYFDLREPPIAVEGFNLSTIWDSRHQKSQRHKWVRNLIKDSVLDEEII